MLGFVGHTVSIATTQLCSYSSKSSHKQYINGCTSVPITRIDTDTWISYNFYLLHSQNILLLIFSPTIKKCQKPFLAQKVAKPKIRQQAGFGRQVVAHWPFFWKECKGLWGQVCCSRVHGRKPDRMQPFSLYR